MVAESSRACGTKPQALSRSEAAARQTISSDVSTAATSPVDEMTTSYVCPARKCSHGVLKSSKHSSTTSASSGLDMTPIKGVLSFSDRLRTGGRQNISAARCLEEFPNGLRHIHELGVAQFRIHGNSQRFGRGAFALREISTFVSEVCE